MGPLTRRRPHRAIWKSIGADPKLPRQTSSGRSRSSAPGDGSGVSSRHLERGRATLSLSPKRDRIVSACASNEASQDYDPAKVALDHPQRHRLINDVRGHRFERVQSGFLLGLLDPMSRSQPQQRQQPPGDEILEGLCPVGRRAGIQESRFSPYGPRKRPAVGHGGRVGAGGSLLPQGRSRESGNGAS